MRPQSAERARPSTTSQDATEAALVATYNSHVDEVYRFCLARCGDIDIAADVTADVFYAATRAFAAGEGDRIGPPWLIAVAKNRLIDHWRRSSRHERRVQRLIEFREGIGVEPDTGHNVPVVASAEVIGVLQSLPDRQRAALALRYLDEYSVAEIADELATSYSAAESLLARARRSFAWAWRNHLSTAETRK